MDILAIRLQKRVRDKLNDKAFQEGMTPSQYVRKLIIKTLKLRLKDIEK